MCDMQEQDVNSISTSLQALYFKTSHFVVHVKFACTHECYVVSVLSFRLSLSLSLSLSLCLSLSLSLSLCVMLCVGFVCWRIGASLYDCFWEGHRLHSRPGEARHVRMKSYRSKVKWKLGSRTSFQHLSQLHACRLQRSAAQIAERLVPQLMSIGYVWTAPQLRPRPRTRLLHVPSKQTLSKRTVIPTEAKRNDAVEASRHSLFLVLLHCEHIHEVALVWTAGFVWYDWPPDAV